MADEKSKQKPAPLETENQQDDNLDEDGNKHGGKKQEQPADHKDGR
jgi:hypothetical protein